MASDIDVRDITLALEHADIHDFTGKYKELGGGEVNDTYLLECGTHELVLRVSRYENQHTLDAEARALKLLNSSRIPKLVFFNDQYRIKDRLWILESYVRGVITPRLSATQFASLGALLAQIHSVVSKKLGVHLWSQFLDVSKAFGTEETLLRHPDPTLREYIKSAHEEFRLEQSRFNLVTPSLTHSDATPSNILVDGDNVGLIDWEFSKFSDPMAEFSTIYYDDMEYNQGKWRIQIRADEKNALFNGYEQAGGKIDEGRIDFWMRFDKLGAAIFLYWRLHESKHEANPVQVKQYELDFKNLIASLSQ